MKNLLIISFIILFSACSSPEKKRIHIIYTTDEHGWFTDNEKADGAAALMHLWEEKEGFSLEADSFLVLSGGDMWTGASESTWFKGQSMFQVMNAMGYDAAAIGNHEFDFSLDTLKARFQRSDFPYLAANISYKNGAAADFALPYVIKEVNGIKVALLGLANTETPNTTMPSSVEDLVFKPYDETLKQYLPEIKAEGADLIIIVSHLCEDEMKAITPLAAQYHIPLITGGHCHTQVMEEKDGVLMIETVPFLRSYIKVVLEYDPQSKNTEVLSYKVVENISEQRNEDIAALSQVWEDASEEGLKTPIGYTAKTIPQTSAEMYHMIMTSWLRQFPQADLAITNAGSIRQDIEKGDISTGDILGLMPFNNGLVQMKMSGKQIKDFIARLPEMEEEYIWGGMTSQSTYEDAKTYEIITNDFLYALHETHFKSYDPQAYNTGIIYREPLIDYIRSLNTSVNHPLDEISQ